MRKINEYFRKLRFDDKYHQGLGDIRLSMGQQEEIIEMFIQLETELAGMELMEAEGDSFAETIVRENEQLKKEIEGEGEMSISNEMRNFSGMNFPYREFADRVRDELELPLQQIQAELAGMELMEAGFSADYKYKRIDERKNNEGHQGDS